MNFNKLMNKYLIATLTLGVAGILIGCGDEPASAPTAPQKKTADVQTVSKDSQVDSKSVSQDANDVSIPRHNSETIFNNPQEYLKTLVIEGDLERDIIVADQMDRGYYYEICIGDKCNRMNKDSTGFFKYSCDKLNSKSPCSSVYNVKVCNDSRECNSKLIDFAGKLKAKKIKVGYEHACAVRLDNSVKCWGNTRGFSNPEGTQTANGMIANDVIVSKSQDVTCVIDPEHNFKCFGADAKRFKPIDSLVRDATVSINSICYVTLDGKVYCIDAKDEDNAYIAYTNSDGSNVNSLKDIRKIESEEFYTVALDYKGKLHLFGYNLDNSKFREIRQYLSKIEDITDVHDFSIGNDAVCVIAGASREVSCYGPKKSFDYTNAEIIGVHDATEISVGTQSACVTYLAGDKTSRVLCGGLPFYFEGVPNKSEVTKISQGNNQVCLIRGNSDVECYGNDYHRNGINFVPEYPVVNYDMNGIVSVVLPKEDNPKLDGAECRINSKKKEVICRIQKLDFLPKDLRLKPKFELNSITGQLYIEGKPYINGQSYISLKPEQEMEIRVENGSSVKYKFKLLQTMKVVKKYDLTRTWTDDSNAITDFSCVWNFSDGSIDEGSCEKTIVHTFETDYEQNKKELKAKVDAYRKDIANGGFDIHHFQPKPIDE